MMLDLVDMQVEALTFCIALRRQAVMPVPSGAALFHAFIYREQKEDRKKERKKDRQKDSEGKEEEDEDEEKKRERERERDRETEIETEIKGEGRGTVRTARHVLKAFCCLEAGDLAAEALANSCSACTSGTSQTPRAGLATIRLPNDSHLQERRVQEIPSLARQSSSTEP